MKRIRKCWKKRSGRTALSLFLAAALVAGGMTTVFATEEPAVEDTTGAKEPAVENTLGAEEPAVENTTGAEEPACEDLAVPGEAAAVYPAMEEGDADSVSVNAEEETMPEASDYDFSYSCCDDSDEQSGMDDSDTAQASVGWDASTRSAIPSDSNLWWIDDYYVGESSQYDTEKTDDFSLKYQVEFHASEDLEAGAVRIVIGASLGTYRDGTNILPTDIGIPYGTPGDFTTSSSSPFNYYYFYYDAGGNEVILTAAQAAVCSEAVYIKVWNYRDIVSGSNAMFQVLYKDMDIMQIADQTEWSLDVSAMVDITLRDEEGTVTGTRTETVDGNTLHGDVDTYATLNSVTKKAYTLASVSYTPELYTESQVSSYINGAIPEPYASHFDDYIYVVWQVSINGTATQAYQIAMDESTFFRDTETPGSVVGFKTYSTTFGVSSSYGADAAGNPTLSYRSDTVRSFSATFYVVTAYSKDDYTENEVLENDIQVTVHPQDGFDDDTAKSASATTTWGEYEWEYKGNSIGISKSGGGTYNAYLTLYELRAAKGEDTGAFSFTTYSTDRGYAYTHVTEGENLGEWIEGSYYTTTTVDDALYAYPNGGTTPSRMLTKDDYYFSSVRITTTDSGYDVWEDKSASPEAYDGVDQDVYIYAMFYEQGADADAEGWEYVAAVPFAAGGTMTYTFSSDDLARQPYRVKVVHSTANYSTSCTVNVNVMLRSDSPVIRWCAAWCEENGIDFDSLKIENVSGVAGQTYGVPGYEDGTYFQSTSTSSSNYSEKDTETGETLAEFTEDLYGTILQRDNAYVTLTRLTETAASYKTVSTENDAANGRVLANYTITAYEAYRVTGSSTVDALKEAGLSLPERHEVVYCDLLPYGMQFNASTDVTAGRITTLSGSWMTNARAWDTAGVTVTVEDTDIIPNWNNTGRTMVYFHIHYDGDDAGAYYNNLWFEGFGISFQAYYDWTEKDSVDAEYNIAAYIVEGVTDESEQLLGTYDSNVFKDDGSANLSAQYAPFLGAADLNGDGVTDWYTNMYASTTTTTDVATASSDDIKKTVRADDDALASYGSTALVGNGRTYTYEVALTNHWGATLSGVVLFDRLEYAVEDGRYEVESAGSGSVFDGLTAGQIEDHWTGMCLGVTTTALDDLGIAAVVYYNADRDAAVSSADGTITPAEVLTEGNGWYTEADFIARYGSLAAACAIAVDLSKKTDGSAFVMEEGTTVSIQIHMQAPEDSAYQYAFNNPMYYSVSTDAAGDVTTATDAGDTVRVEIGEVGALEVEKAFSDADRVPGSLMNQKFSFVLSRQAVMADGSTQEQILANQEYMIYTWDADIEAWVPSGVVGATDINGQFTLRAGQKAVFSHLANVKDILVTEVESVLWVSTGERIDTSDTESSCYFENTYRSPVYFYKTVQTTDLATEEELAEAAFTFQILVDTDGDGVYEPYANGEYLYVKEVLTDGTSPAVDTGKGEAGHGVTDANGEVTLHIGDILVFFPCDAEGNYSDVPYRIIETSMGEEWVNPDGDTVEGTTSDYGTSETITNYYKYRKLILTKDLSDYDHDIAACEDTWTFQLNHVITDEEGREVVVEPVAGNHWYMIDADGNPVCDANGDPIEGTLDSQGEFSFAGAGEGRRVVIEKLVEGEQYTLTETNYDAELYEPVNGGTADMSMPTYGITRSIEITNKYLKKDLSVEKLVLTDEVDDEIRTHVFTFTLQQLVDGDYVPVAEAGYTIGGEAYTTDEDGQFTLRHGETAYFDDLGYQEDTFRVVETADDALAQIYPVDGEPFTGTLGSDGTDMRFINGSFANVVSLTKDLTGLDEVGEAFVDLVREDNTAATLAGEGGAVPYTVEVTFGVYDGDACVTEAEGALIGYESGNADYPYVYIKTLADGSYTVRSYNGGVMTEELAPYDFIYIAEIGSYTVKASESSDMERVLLGVSSDRRAVVGSESILSEGTVMSGSAAANENIVLVNEISSAHYASEIYKLMTEDSDTVPAGSEITFLVERYNGESWAPAGGIKYITFDGYTGEYDTTDCVVTSGVLVTGADGRITLTAGEDGYPYIRFIEDTVYANIPDADAKAGDIRIVESSRDEAWGHLAGYDSEEWNNGPAYNITYADTFVNANDDGLVFEVEKEMAEGDADAAFTFTVMQVISAVSSPVTSMEQITETAAGAGLYYIVYDVETGERIADGYTDAKGSFMIKAGQYAAIYAPAGTAWYVYERTNPGYPLYSAEANDDPAGDGSWGYAKNASIVDAVNGVVQETTKAELKPVKVFAVYSADDGSLTFYTRWKVPQAGGMYNGKTATNVYTGFENKKYTTYYSAPWYDKNASVKKIVIDDSFAKAAPTSLAYWFYGFRKADFIGLGNINTSSVTTLQGTFGSCRGLSSVDDLAGWDVDSVTTLFLTFYDCSGLTNVDGLAGWDTSSVTSLDSTFYGCNGLSNVDALADWDTGGVTTLRRTFFDCGLSNVDCLAGWDTSSVTSMDSTFYGCNGLSNVDGLTDWDTGGVTTLYRTFYSCKGLSNVDDLAGWDTSSVTSLESTFYDCSGLSNVDGLAGWDTSCVTSLDSTFYGCNGLSNVDGLADWDTGGVTTLYRTFYSCRGLTSVNVSKWNTAKVTDMRNMFYACSGLMTIYSDDEVFVTSAVTSGVSMFASCSKLVGGNGTAYSFSQQGSTMAHIDTDANPGYFTDVAEKP